MGTRVIWRRNRRWGHKDEIDFRVDQFALGAILYEMLAGKPAFFVPGEPMMQNDTAPGVRRSQTAARVHAVTAFATGAQQASGGSAGYPFCAIFGRFAQSADAVGCLRRNFATAYERQHHEPHRTKRVWPGCLLVLDDRGTCLPCRRYRNLGIAHRLRHADPGQPQPQLQSSVGPPLRHRPHGTFGVICQG